MRITVALALSVSACAIFACSGGEPSLADSSIDQSEIAADARSIDAIDTSVTSWDSTLSNDVESGASRVPCATRVVSFEPGPGAGFGQNRLPDVVLGPPVGGGDMRGGTDVVSLGAGGTICLAFDTAVIVDGPGADFIVFENPFYISGTSTSYAELGEVSVSEDGVTYATFQCTQSGPPFTGCAGWTPVYSNPNNAIAPNDVAHAGGDAFDLAAVGIHRARYVCIHDLMTIGPSPPSTGFDLDAISAVNWE